MTHSLQTFEPFSEKNSNCSLKYNSACISLYTKKNQDMKNLVKCKSVGKKH